jgi:hypothetical protein
MCALRPFIEVVCYAHRVHKSTTQKIDVKQKLVTFNAHDAADGATNKVACFIIFYIDLLC